MIARVAVSTFSQVARIIIIYTYIFYYIYDHICTFNSLGQFNVHPCTLNSLGQFNQSASIFQGYWSSDTGVMR